MNPRMIRSISAALLSLGLAATALAQSTLADAEVRKVDKSRGKITLKHGEIANIDMPPMTMVFPVRDKALLDKVKAGDKVKFAAEKDGAGEIVVTAIEVQR
jgi:Cu(I)/Ag(I) efflux system protein CusF